MYIFRQSIFIGHFTITALYRWLEIRVRPGNCGRILASWAYSLFPGSTAGEIRILPRTPQSRSDILSLPAKDYQVRVDLMLILNIAHGVNVHAEDYPQPVV